MREWLELEPEWLDVTQRQNPEKTKSDLAKDMPIDAHNGARVFDWRHSHGPLRTKKDSRRAEKQLLLRHNRDEIVQLKQDAAQRKTARRSVE
ncbi:hypothetical protein PHPALM_12523 [Phytophthora palmivora]|uniref:Uncharacterized protein n=1 Tax=Phytophthora palmivora TaxID=4796 RepID=A0A2P4XZI1_9STRA|nr:hypothetical protein PHPALM_12523 [Phytophthora palmivora]